MSLYFLAALLIREGYLGLEALFPHVRIFYFPNLINTDLSHAACS